jgi:hypothetical protein
MLFAQKIMNDDGESHAIGKRPQLQSNRHHHRRIAVHRQLDRKEPCNDAESRVGAHSYGWVGGWEVGIDRVREHLLSHSCIFTRINGLGFQPSSVSFSN